MLLPCHLTCKKHYVKHQWTKSMEHSPWKANSRSAGQDILCKFWIWMFITIFTRAYHWSLSWARWNHSIPTYPISLRSIWCYLPIYVNEHPNNIWWRSSLCSLLQLPVTSSLLDPNIFLSTLFSNILNQYWICILPSISVRDEVSYPNKTATKIIHISVPILLDIQDSDLSGWKYSPNLICS